MKFSEWQLSKPNRELIMMFQQDKYINLFLIKQIFFNKFYKISKTLFNKCLSYFWQNINDSTKTN